MTVYIAFVACAYAGVSGISTVYSLLTTLNARFDAPLQIGWVVTVYFLVSAAAAAICGRLGDQFGRRRVILLVLPVAAVGAAISASSESLEGVIVGCAIQGTAGALTPLTLGLARETLPAGKIPFAVGVIMAALVAGGGLSFWVAGFIVDHFSWTGGFWMKVGLATVAALAVLLFIPVSRSGTVPVLSIPIDYRLLLRRPVFLANACLAFLCLGCMQHGQILSLFLQQPRSTGTGFGLSATESGRDLLLVLSVAFVAGPLGGSLVARHGVRRAAVVGFLAGFSTWALNAAYHHSLWLFLALCVGGTVGVAVVQTAAYNLIMRSVPENRTSEAVGLSAVLISVYMAVGSQLVTALVATPTDTAWSLTFALVSLMSLCGLLVGLSLPVSALELHSQPGNNAIEGDGHKGIERIVAQTGKEAS